MDAVKASIDAALADHPDAKVLDQQEFEKVASGFVDKMLTFVTVMLLLAVLIALLGIVNTLALSVYERTRELGLLRAVGMTRGQVRAMVRWESVVISLIGAAAGAALGIGIGVALSQALKDEGIDAISNRARAIADDLVALRRELHKVPELDRHLPKSQALILEALEGLDLEITLGKELSSVTAVLRGGGGPGPVVLLRGDMDALPVQELLDVDYVSTPPRSDARMRSRLACRCSCRCGQDPARQTRHRDR